MKELIALILVVGLGGTIFMLSMAGLVQLITG